MTASAVVIPLTRISIVRSSNIDSDSSHRPQHMPPYAYFCQLAHEEVVSAVRWRQFSALQWKPAVVLASENVVHPHLFSVCFER